MQNAAYHSTKRDDYITPPCVIDRVRAVCEIALDPCAGDRADHAKVNNRFEPDIVVSDGLKLGWQRVVEVAGGGLAYVNPPYGGRKRVIDAWIEKCVEEAEARVDIIALVPASTGAAWFRRIYSTAAAACAWSGRMRFVDPATMEPAKNTAPFWSWIILWTRHRIVVDRFLDAFEDAGDLYLFSQPPSHFAVSPRAASGLLIRRQPKEQDDG